MAWAQAAHQTQLSVKLTRYTGTSHKTPKRASSSMYATSTEAEPIHPVMLTCSSHFTPGARAYVHSSILHGIPKDSISS